MCVFTVVVELYPCAICRPQGSRKFDPLFGKAALRKAQVAEPEDGAILATPS